MKDSALPVTAFEKLPPEKTAGKFPTGVLFKKEASEYCEIYYGMVDRIRKASEGRA